MAILEITNRTIPTEYSRKYSNFLLKRDSVEVLILGNSHSLRGINPNNLEFDSYNLSMVSQRIHTDLDILKNELDSMQNLKIVILNISHFSLGKPLYGDEYESRLYFYNKVYGLDYKPNNIIQRNLVINSYGFKKSLSNILRYFFFNSYQLESDNNGWMGEGGFLPRNENDFDQNALETSRRHLEIDYLNPIRNKNILNEIVSLIESKNLKILFVITPKSKNYLNKIPPDHINFQDSVLNSVVEVNKSSYLLNLRSNQGFDRKDFRNPDHLNLRGSAKLSDIINSKINDIIK